MMPPRAAPYTGRAGVTHFAPPVRPNPALQQQIFRRNQKAFRQREVFRLMQQGRYTREQALIAANAALTAQNASLQAQAAAQAAQQQGPQMPAQQPTTAVSPAAPSADLTPQQDAADGGEAAPPTSVEPVPHHKSKLLLFAGLAVVAGVGGYVLLKKKRPAVGK